MSATVVGFFGPTDTLVPGGNWTVQDASASKSFQRFGALGDDGDEVASKLYGERRDLAQNYEDVTETGSLTLPMVGDIGGDHHLDNFTVRYTPTAFPTLALSGHKHGASAHGACARMYALPVILPAQWGCPRTLLATREIDPEGLPPAYHPALFTLGNDDAGIGVKSITVTMSCTHQDETGETGEQIAAENRDGVCRVEVQLLGVPAALTFPDDEWDFTSDGTPKANTAADTYSFTLEKHVAFYVAP